MATCYRYRLNVKGLPGKPDIVLRPYHTAIFVNGCFWHEHEGCKQFRKPKSNIEFWQNKILRNRERDLKNYQILHDNGWNIIVIWECQLRPKLLKNTMLQVESQLCDNLLNIHKHKIITYDSQASFTPIAAENGSEYKTK